MEVKRLASHRDVDRESGRLITQLSEKTLKARGFTAAERSFMDDEPLQAGSLLMSLPQKKDEFELTSRGTTKKGPKKTLQEFVLNARRTGYDVRLAKQPGIDYFRAYLRFDLDRFITRVPEDLLMTQGYSLEKKQLRFHAWGDSLENYNEDQQEEYAKENEEIIQFVKNREKQNFHVRLLERKYEDGYVLVPFTRPKGHEDSRPPFEADRPLTGITTEKPSALLAKGFKILKTIGNDGSLTVIPGKTLPLGFDNAYLAAIEYVQKFGTLPQSSTEPAPTIREQIIRAASRGYEIRAYQANYYPDTGAFMQDPEFLTLFQRFDLVRFIEPPDTAPVELLKNGFAFDVNMSLTAWGDGPKKPRATDMQLVRTEQNAVEKYVQDKEARGYMVRFIVGKYDFATKKQQNDPTYLSAFIRQKR
ncbi:MAG: hypothetical protein Q8P56_02670 [Candidatus Uhrbacteria bacterium]|nr:hypothetical protein [Candidatus Uhrbacteria bacterium]